MGGGGGSRGPSREQQEIHALQLKDLQREEARLERRRRRIESGKTNPLLHTSPSGVAPAIQPTIKPSATGKSKTGTGITNPIRR